VEKRVATAAPALCLLQRRQLLRLAEQTAGAALLGAPSLVVSHDLKLSAGTAARGIDRFDGSRREREESVAAGRAAAKVMGVRRSDF
jgi:hypothetical protein